MTSLTVRYAIGDALGRGAFGTVYVGIDRQTGLPVAIKVLDGSIASGSVVAQRFIREAKAAARLSHPHIVRIFGSGTTADGRLFLVMEALRGHDLAYVIDKMGAQSPSRVIGLSRQILSALDAAHGRGVVHRDIKPGNIFVSHEEHVTVLDFGLAGMLTNTDATVGPLLTRPGDINGTPGYMAPEQARGRAVDGRADLYSVGAVLYQLLSGRMPFRGDSAVDTLMMQMTDPVPPLRDYAPRVSPRLAEIIESCLSAVPSGRPASAAELLPVFKSLARPRPTSAVSPRCRKPLASRSGLRRRSKRH